MAEEQGTFYNYAKREASDYVNWGQISRDMTTMLNEEQRIRQEKRDQIDEDVRKLNQELNNSPEALHTGLKQWSLDYADKGKNYLLMTHKLLKSGQMDAKTFVRNRQNLNDATEEVYAMVKSYNEYHKETMERMNTGQSQELEHFLAEQVEGFGQFSKNELYINPANGMVSVVRKGEDGAEDFISLASMKGAMQGRYDKFDTQAEVNKGAEYLGKYMKDWRTTDARDNPEYDGYKNKFIESLMANDYHLSSILTEDLFDLGISHTRDEDEFNNSTDKILVTFDPESGQPKLRFKDEQKEAVKKYLDEQFEGMVDRELKRYTPLNKGNVGGGSGKKEKVIISDLVNIFGGNESEGKSSMHRVLSTGTFQGEKLKKVQRVKDDDGNYSLVFITESGKKTTPIDISNSSAYDFIKEAAAAFYGDKGLNIDDAIKLGGYTVDQLKNTPATAWTSDVETSIEEPPKELTSDEVISKKLNLLKEGITDDDLKLNGSFDEDEAKEVVQKLLDDAGIKGEVMVAHGGRDMIKIQLPNKPTSDKWDVNENLIQEVIDYLSTNYDVVDFEFAREQGRYKDIINDDMTAVEEVTEEETEEETEDGGLEMPEKI